MGDCGVNNQNEQLKYRVDKDQLGTSSFGSQVLRDPNLNKGRAFTIRERQLLGIHGLLPPSVLTIEQQCQSVLENFNRWDNDLDRYIYLMSLQDRNEKLFYKVVMDNIDLMMPVIYTPTVGLACQKYGMIFRKPRGLYITIHDKGHVFDVLCNWPEKDVKAIVVTDGERILGLGDLGSYGMGIPVGKLSLYTACAGVKPHQCLPITLDVGTNRQTLIDDPMYIGLRKNRTTGQEYDDFIDEFMQAVVKRYGQNTLIQFEDFGNHNAFRFLEKYRSKYCTFNDDIQGTAAVTVAGILASLQITNTKLSDNTFLFQGAGEAAIGIANLIVMAMEQEGTSREKAIAKIWMVDSKGLIVKNRPAGGLTPLKEIFAKNHEPLDKLEDIVMEVKPSALIGVAAVAGAFTERVIKDMATVNTRPIIFALSNPTSKAECTAEQAYKLTEGRVIFASGSPFDPVTVNERTFYPGQGNNAYIFPGVALGVILCGVRHISDAFFLKSAQGLARMVSEKDLEEGRVYPPLKDIFKVSTEIAVQITEYAYQAQVAAHYPEPPNKREFVMSQLYSTEYENFIPDFYDWPCDPCMMKS